MYRKFVAGILSITCCSGILSGVAVNANDSLCKDAAKNIIYIIGEGMGANLIQYTQWKHTSAYNELNMQQMSVSGLVSTYSADSGTSDDASAGTQLATGSGTDNGVIGMGAELDEYRQYENLMEAAERSGKSTGVISDSELSESVASAFIAHSSDADDKEGIQSQIDDAELDVKISGSVSLADDTTTALNTLSSSEDGFVLVIDSAKIEDCITENDSVGAMDAVKALDDAVGAALEFAKQDGETLVIVTAEHEAGSVAETDLISRSSGSDTITWLSTEPSYTNVMLFAEGRGAEHFNGYYHNTDICRKIAHIMGITDWDFYDVVTEFEMPEETQAPEPEEEDILNYDFEGIEAGTTVVTDTINGNNGELFGNAEIVYDEALGSNVLKLDNTVEAGNYLELPCGVFNQMQYLTIEMDIKSDQLFDKNSSTFQMADTANPSKYFYFKYEPLGQGIRYSLNPGSEWKSSGNKELSDIGGEDWVKLRFVVEPTKHTVYINDEEALTYETKGSLSMLGSNLYAYIGHSLFSVDKDYSGSFDNIKISGIKQEEAQEDTNKIKISVEVTPAEAVTDENDMPDNTENNKAKNVIILIGDGMGQNVAQLSQWHYNGATNPYAMQTMPYIGLSKTYSANNGVTDSAAGGTAMATGRKTNNGFISSGGAGVRYKNLMEYAHDHSMATGIVATTDITDATPAVFSSHVIDRGYRAEIAQQQSESGTDIFMGGGGERFTTLIDKMKSDGYKYITTATEMNSLDKDDKVLGLFGYSGDLVQPIDGNTTEPLLPDMVQKSIEMLDGRSDNGFVLMAEGSTIDHYAHSNHADGAIEQTKLFDDAVKKALEFAKQDGNTLVIVSADHETGGLALLENGNTDAGTAISGKYAWTTGNHSSAYVPIYAYGPGADKFTGIHENTDIFELSMSSLGIEKDKRPVVTEGDKRLILELDFDDANLDTKRGSAVGKGTLSYEKGYKGKAVSFDTNAENYIELFDDKGNSLLGTADTFTVSYWSKTDKNNSPNWMFYAAPGSAIQANKAEVYIGLLDTGSSIIVERYLNGRAATPSASFTGDEWKHMAIVFDKDKTLLYVNGELKSSVDSTFDIADILEFDPVAYIGRANWGNGESAKGLLDEFKIHNYCLSPEQITMLYTDGSLPEDFETEIYAEYMSDEIRYTLSIKDPTDEDVYIALYNSDGRLIDIHKGKAEAVVKGKFTGLNGEKYIIGAYMWENGTMIPVWSDKQEVEKYTLMESLAGSASGGGSKTVIFGEAEGIFAAPEQILQVNN